jgi:hypothetical protein
MQVILVEKDKSGTVKFQRQGSNIRINTSKDTFVIDYQELNKAIIALDE